MLNDKSVGDFVGFTANFNMSWFLLVLVRFVRESISRWKWRFYTAEFDEVLHQLLHIQEILLSGECIINAAYMSIVW